MSTHIFKRLGRSSVLSIAIVATAFSLMAWASSAQAALDITSFDGNVLEQNGDPTTQAGSHPFTGSTSFFLSTVVTPAGDEYSTEELRDAFVDLPPGLVGNPQAVGACTQAQLQSSDSYECPLDSQVGMVTVWKNGFFGTPGNPAATYYGIYNLVPPRGTVALLGFNVGGTTVHVAAKVRTSGDYGVTAYSTSSPMTFPLAGVTVTLWGTPADPTWDLSRSPQVGCLNHITGVSTCPVSAGVPPRAFFTLPTSCVGPVRTDLAVAGWQGGGDTSSFLSHDNASPVPNPIGNDGCEVVPFTPSVSVAPTSASRDSATGLDVGIGVPPDGLLDPDGVSQAHLRKTVVSLPEGLSVNPSGATGLAACSDAQLGLGSDAVPSCPEASKIATVDVATPLLAEHLTGHVVLRSPRSTDPMSGEMLRMAIVARSVERGILVKLAGSATADPVTGQLVATFDENPQVPFSDLEVKVKGGQRGMLATPQDCATVSTSTELTPWSATAPVVETSPFNVAGDCSLGFTPQLAAGMDNPKARGTGSFSFRFSREDGEQWIDGLTAMLPQGLLASVKDFPLCTSSQADTGTCPAGSRVGTVDATAGTGTPFVLERKGDAYLTEGYKGCPYGLAVKVPVIAGPFDASSPETDLGNIIVRQAVCVDRSTAQVSAISDPLPTIWHGIPIRTRSVTVKVDRPGFMLNPSDCTAKQIGAKLHSTRGTSAGATAPFHATACANLPFKPKLKLALTGKKQITTGKHPGIKATVTQKGIGEAGIKRAVVRLPKSIALDPNNAQALCEFTDGTKPDLENHCPKGSIVGKAKATSPLLNDPLTGNVYFVKNVRIDPKTGNTIRTLPMIIVALRGEIAVNLKGESSTTNAGKLVNTFNQIPDAPISQFNLDINGGNTGILAVTRTRTAKINLCTGRHTAETDMDAQNGRRHDFDVRMKTPCTKKQTKAAKLRAKRAAAKANRR